MAGSLVGRGVEPRASEGGRPGLLLAARGLRSRAPAVADVSLAELPRLSRRAIALALRLNPRFLDAADLDDPILVAGRGRAQLVLDGRHRLSKATWTSRPSLPVVRVPLWYALELLTPGVYEIEWLLLTGRRALRARARSSRTDPERARRSYPPRGVSEARPTAGGAVGGRRYAEVSGEGVARA